MTELENYITPNVMNIVYGEEFQLGEREWRTLDVPTEVAYITHRKSESTKVWDELSDEKIKKKVSKAKNKINQVTVNEVKKNI